MFLNAASHSRAMAVEQATLASLGTHRAALSLGNRSAAFAVFRCRVV